MPQEIVSQSDQFGLPEQHREFISQEKIAEQLAPPQPWQGPGRLASDHEDDFDEYGPDLDETRVEDHLHTSPHGQTMMKRSPGHPQSRPRHEAWQGPTRLAEYGEVGSVQDPMQNYDMYSQKGHGATPEELHSVPGQELGQF